MTYVLGILGITLLGLLVAVRLASANGRDGDVEPIPGPESWDDETLVSLDVDEPTVVTSRTWGDESSVLPSAASKLGGRGRTSRRSQRHG